MSSNAKTAKRCMRVPSAPSVLLYWVVETILHYLWQLIWELLAAFRAVMTRQVQMRSRRRRRRPRRAMVMKRPVQMRPPQRLRRRARSAYGDEMTKLCLVGVGRPNEWVLDSGVSIHHTSNLELLLDVQFQETTTGKDDALLTPSRSGNVVLGLGSVRTERFEFPGVRYDVVVGDDDVAGSNVVSVSQLARDHGLVTVFEPTSCHVKDKNTGQILGKGRLRNGMYMLDYLRIVGGKVCALRDGTADGGGGHGGQGSNGQVGEGHGGGGARDGRGEGAGARNQQEEGSGSGAAGSGGDVNNDEIKEEEEEDKGSDEKQMKAIDRKGENEQDYKRGLRRGRLMPLLLMVSSASVAVLTYSAQEDAIIIIGNPKIVLSAVTSAHTLSVFGMFLQVYNPSMMQSMTTICKQIGSLFRGSSGDRECKQEETCHQEHNKRLFGLSRFHETKDPTGCRRRYLPAKAFPDPASINAARRREDFLVDSSASFHMTWKKEPMLLPYPQHLQSHTKPPTWSFEGITGSIAVTRSGYLDGDKIKLDGVLLAPEARANLVSVGQLLFQYRVQVEMDEDGVIIKNQQEGVQIGGGRMLNDLYVLEYFKPPEGLFAHHSPTPQFKVFGRRRPYM